MKQFKKLAFFDFDGTLTFSDQFIYNELYASAGISLDASEANFAAFRAGKITYDQWTQRDVGLFQATRMTRDRMLSVIRNIAPMTGARETILELKKRDYGIIVVSGGIDVALETFGDWKTLFDRVFINQYVFSESGLLIDVIATPYDQQHKATCIKDMCTQYGVDIKDTIFTGDNINDVEAARAAGISFAFNTDKPALIDVATHHIVMKDLREILKFI